MNSAVPWGTVVHITTPGLRGEGYPAGAVTFSLGIEQLPLFPFVNLRPQGTECLSPLECEQDSGPPQPTISLSEGQHGFTVLTPASSPETNQTEKPREAADTKSDLFKSLTTRT